MPPWLDGTKFNNGFGDFEVGPPGTKPSINHLADVMSYYMKVKVSNGTVRLRNKVQHTEYWQRPQKCIPPYRTFNGTTPPMGLIDKAEAMKNMKPNDNLNVAALQLNLNAPDRILATLT